ncbi:hypothetical protein [Streptomyces sp. NPDC088789]|uniref:hypothetical protein n=1 Tax=Streptomyces sp. NPDC088789 TaxID=3365899 RepID=UPI003818968C
MREGRGRRPQGGTASPSLPTPAPRCPGGHLALALRCARLVDVVAAEMLTDRTVLVDGERITAVLPGPAPVLDGVELLDLGDATSATV